MKISIRANILIVFMTLLAVVSLAIISVDYYTSHKIVRNSAKLLLKNSVRLVQTKLEGYFLPYKILLGHSAAMSKKKITKIGAENYLRTIIEHHPHLLNIYFGTPDGKLLEIKRHGNKLTTKHIIAGRYYDHRKRDWYKMALAQKKYILSNFYLFLQPRTVGITAAKAIYNKTGKLLGVMGMDIPLQNIIHYTKTIQISKNSIILMADRAGNIISSKHRHDHHDPISLQDPSIAWVAQAFKENKKSGKTDFMYDFNNKKYIASFYVLHHPNLNIHYVVIIAPDSDIVGLLQAGLKYSILLAILILLVGALITLLVSRQISLSIIKLAEEADDIRKLNLHPVKIRESRIKEIYHMQRSFTAMRNALHSFARYVPFRLVKKLITSRKIAEVGGETREITLFFSDIEGFTSISENMSPTELTSHLSEYFEKMTQLIHQNHGTVDKYVGDEVMAFWGAPTSDKDQAYNCCQCALASINILTELNKKWRQTNKPELMIRIGINSGDAVVGNIGSEDRLSYTAMGDSVNLASRLQDINKIYHSNIAVSKTTYEQIKDKFEFRLLDCVAVRGRKQGCYVYELLTETIPNLEHYNKNFSLGFETYMAGKWKEAIKLFNTLMQQYPQDMLLKLYIERCQTLQQKKPRNWHGTWVQYD